ncbi:MAG: hypothetical protein RL386_1282, partial [Bacteroidota bacterium]
YFAAAGGENLFTQPLSKEYSGVVKRFLLPVTSEYYFE